MATMARTMILYFTIFLFLFIFPFQLTMAQSPGAPPAPAPPGKAPPAPATPPATPPRCDINDSNYTPGVSIPLNQIKDKTSTGADVKIAGTVSYLNGCTFLISGFTYYFAATGS